MMDGLGGSTGQYSRSIKTNLSLGKKGDRHYFLVFRMEMRGLLNGVFQDFPSFFLLVSRDFFIYGNSRQLPESGS